MEKFKNHLADQIKLIVDNHSPYLDKMTEVEKKDLEDLKSCLQILQKDNG